MADARAGRRCCGRGSSEMLQGSGSRRCGAGRDERDHDDGRDRCQAQDPPSGHVPSLCRRVLLPASYTARMAMTDHWLQAPHWSTDIPLDSPHPRLDALAERGYVVLRDLDHPVPEHEYLSLEYMDWKSGGDTNFAPIATADGELDCRGFWKEDDPRPDKDGKFTTNCGGVPDTRRGGAIGRRQLRACAHDQARAPGLRHRQASDPPRRQQPLQPRHRRLGRAVVARAHRLPRQLHDPDGAGTRRPARTRAPRSGSRCTAARASCSTPNGSGTSSATTGPQPRYALISSFESGPALDYWIASQR